MAEASNSPPPAAIARATRSRKGLTLPSLLETQQPLPMTLEQGSTGQRRSSRSAPKRGEGLALSPTTGVSPMVTRGKQAKDENDGKDKDHGDEAPPDRWRSSENSTKRIATPPPILDVRCVYLYYSCKKKLHIVFRVSNCLAETMTMSL